MRISRTIATIAASALAATSLVACSNESDDATNAEAGGDENVTVKIGTTDADQKAWSVFSDLAAEEGIDLDIVQFSDYAPVNEALAQGELDLNKFQHILYLLIRSILNNLRSQVGIHSLILLKRSHVRIIQINFFPEFRSQLVVRPVAQGCCSLNCQYWY